MRDDEFEWDDRKAAENFDKHGVTFWLARQAFQDPDWYEDADPDPHEERYNRLCAIDVDGDELVLHVTYAERGKRIRIISARRATRHEQQTYDRNRP